MILRESDIWRRDHGYLCEAVTLKGTKCMALRKFGQLCGVHYTIAEADINKITLVSA
jgi:hypothetical protein